MKLIAQIVSWAALAALIIPPILYLGDQMALTAVKTWMLVATVVWFSTVPLWMGRKT